MHVGSSDHLPVRIHFGGWLLDAQRRVCRVDQTVRASSGKSMNRVLRDYSYSYQTEFTGTYH